MATSGDKLSASDLDYVLQQFVDNISGELVAMPLPRHPLIQILEKRAVHNCCVLGTAFF